MHQHAHLILSLVGLVLAAVGVWLVRRLFDRRRGVPLPIEDEVGTRGEQGTHTIVEE